MSEKKDLKGLLSVLSQLSEAVASVKDAVDKKDDEKNEDPKEEKTETKEEEKKEDAKEKKDAEAAVHDPSVGEKKDEAEAAGKEGNKTLETDKTPSKPSSDDLNGNQTLQADVVNFQAKKNTEPDKDSLNGNQTIQADDSLKNGKIGGDSMNGNDALKKDDSLIGKENASTDDDSDASLSETDKMKKQMASLSKKLEDAEASIELYKQEASRKLAEKDAEKEEELKKAKADYSLKTLTNVLNGSEVFNEYNLDDQIKAILTEFSPVALASKYTELKKEHASLIEQTASVKKTEVAEARFNELATAGLTFSSEKVAEQKERISGMTDEAFASYKSDLKNLASTIVIEDPKALIQKAKEKAGAKSEVVKHLQTVNKLDKYSKFL